MGQRRDMPASKRASEPPSPGAPLEFRVLGPFELGDPLSGTLVPVSAEKMRALLVFLAAAPRFTVMRRDVAGLLWANDEGRARHNLRQLLSSFRRIADARATGVITYDDNTISLASARLSIDRTAFLDIKPDADAGELRRTADLYRGEFAAGLLTGEGNFDEWLEAERVHLRDAAISLFDRLVRMLAEAGEHRDALAYANRLVTFDPYREETHRLVLAAEATVSGRASAMARFESFQQLLGKELGVRPERATRRLMEQLREASPDAKPAQTIAPLAAVEASTNKREVIPRPHVSDAQTQPPNSSRSRPLLIAVAAVLLLGVAPGVVAIRHFGPSAYQSFAGEDAGRVSVILLPFEIEDRDGAQERTARAYEAEAGLAFARDNRLSLVEFTGHAPPLDAVSAGRTLHARYVVKTRVSDGPGAPQADISLFDSENGTSVAASTVPMTADKLKFARELFRFIYPEIVLHRARTLAVVAPDSVSAMLWRAEAARIKTRVGAAAPDEFKLFETVLERDPNQLYALLGLADGLILKVAREQSQNRTEDIARSAAFLVRAREQAPNMAMVAFDEGMLNKLQGRFEQASVDFERAFRLDRTHWNAAAQAAHVKIFLGRFEEAYTEMEAATRNLLPDIAAAETAYIAGETALVAGHPERATDYLAMAIGGNANVARIHGMYAAALWVAGRPAEARAEAARSQSLTPAYSPELMTQRGRATSSPRYQAARDQYVTAYRAALAPPQTSTN